MPVSRNHMWAYYWYVIIHPTQRRIQCALSSRAKRTLRNQFWFNYVLAGFLTPRWPTALIIVILTIQYCHFYFVNSGHNTNQSNLTLDFQRSCPPGPGCSVKRWIALPPDKSLSRRRVLGKPIALSSEYIFIQWKAAIQRLNNQGQGKRKIKEKEKIHYNILIITCL